MKISRIRLAGFRGVRNELALEVPVGFLIVVGRNGTGKSTLCDAVEYALTGTIRGEVEHVEKGEGITDYIWWRGPSPAEDRYVELEFVDDRAERYLIRRTPTGVESSHPNLEALLCRTNAGITFPLRQLCRTAILRAEDITHLSVDLRESDRFQFVRDALGTADFSHAHGRAREVLDFLTREAEKHNAAYIAASSRVAESTGRLSEIQNEAQKATGIEAAKTTLRQFLNLPHDSEIVLTLVEQRLADVRVRMDRQRRLYSRLSELMSKQQTVESAAFNDQVNAVSDQVNAATDSIRDLETQVAAINQQLSSAAQSNPHTTLWATLREHGERIGLIDGLCPLCGTAKDEAAFRQHLAHVADQIESASAHIASLAKNAAELKARLTQVQSQRSQLVERLDNLRRRKSELDLDWDLLRREAQDASFDLPGATVLDLAKLAAAIEGDRMQVSHAEEALATIWASHLAEQVVQAEFDLKAARQETVALERRLARVRRAANRAKEASDTIRRVQGEFVNEQLAQLEPLMLELYQRLRPHIDWPDVKYKLRGDVRRMLSLEVGEGINPSFVFSSGQRRAAGLAFLLALHLSRSWCQLRTLILDDPVQHIDDYRALHLTEVLAAIRTTDRQVICAVEDESLGDLLSRRLRSKSGSPGMLIQMGYSSGQGVFAHSKSLIRPLPNAVLIRA